MPCFASTGSGVKGRYATASPGITFGAVPQEMRTSLPESFFVYVVCPMFFSELMTGYCPSGVNASVGFGSVCL